MTGKDDHGSERMERSLADFCFVANKCSLEDEKKENRKAFLTQPAEQPAQIGGVYLHRQ